MGSVTKVVKKAAGAVKKVTKKAVGIHKRAATAAFTGGVSEAAGALGKMKAQGAGAANNAVEDQEEINKKQKSNFDLLKGKMEASISSKPKINPLMGMMRNRINPNNYSDNLKDAYDRTVVGRTKVGSDADLGSLLGRATSSGQSIARDFDKERSISGYKTPATVPETIPETIPETVAPPMRNMQSPIKVPRQERRKFGNKRFRKSGFISALKSSGLLSKIAATKKTKLGRGSIGSLLSGLL